MGSMATSYGVHYKRLLVVTELFNIAVNDFDAQKSARYSRVLLVTELVVSVNPRYKVFERKLLLVSGSLTLK